MYIRLYEFEKYFEFRSEIFLIQWRLSDSREGGMKINSRGQDSFFLRPLPRSLTRLISKGHIDIHTYIHTYESVPCFYFRPSIISC